MAFTFAGCLVGYVIVAILFSKVLHLDLDWGRGALTFLGGWVLATLPGWIGKGELAYEGVLQVAWPILSYGVVFSLARLFLRPSRQATTEPAHRS